MWVAVWGEEGYICNWEILILTKVLKISDATVSCCKLATAQGYVSFGSCSGIILSILVLTQVSPFLWEMVATDRDYKIYSLSKYRFSPAVLGGSALGPLGKIQRCVQNRMCSEPKINHLTKLQPVIILIMFPNLSVLETHIAQLGRRHEIILQTFLISTFHMQRNQTSPADCIDSNWNF